jgi:two-component system nitrogen regulation response regulator GlnG
MRRFNRELGREVREVAPEAMDLLRRCPWPGNIRELQSVLKQALLQASGTVLIPAFLPEALTRPAEPAAAAPAPAGEAEFRVAPFVRQRLQDGSEDLYAEAHRELDRVLLALVLQSTNGNQVQAARVLGIARQTLRTKLRETGLTITRSVEGGDDDKD